LTTAATAFRYMTNAPILGFNDDINHATINRNDFTKQRLHQAPHHRPWCNACSRLHQHRH
jgi:hypothetical protein